MFLEKDYQANYSGFPSVLMLADIEPEQTLEYLFVIAEQAGEQAKLSASQIDHSEGGWPVRHVANASHQVKLMESLDEIKALSPLIALMIRASIKD